jgi:hypothetical protein
MNLSNSPMMLITCILYRSAGVQLLQALFDRGIFSASMQNARGTAVGDTTDSKGFLQEFQKEIVTILVKESEADEIFEFAFHSAQIDRPYGGLLYMQRLDHAAPIVNPQI